MTPERWRQVEELYHAALMRDESDRRAFLAGACAGDEALRREVEALLTQPPSALEFLNDPAVAMGAQLFSDTGVSVLSGRRLGAYQVHERIGVGGMGEVYRARDVKLGRDVAIKILPRAFTSDPERLARFEREARMLAAFNHPNIATIHGLEQADGVHALVLELVEGETLAERIAKGSGIRDRGSGLPVADALAIARQIADALEAAHEKGIIHRDLKPANIKITPEGVVKVLDFGLAKAVASDSSCGLSQSPTMTVGATRQGAILGTAAYMSPEQARGLPVDKRTDIWAFGCILYEMFTGRRPFAGETASDVIAATLRGEPDWSLLSASLPDPMARLARRCLEKDPRRRLRDVGEARVALDEALPPGRGARTHERYFNVRSRGVATLAAAALGAVAIIAAMTWLPREESRDVPADATRLTVTLPPDQEVNSGGGAHPLAISPDGRRVVYAADTGAHTQLFIRALDAFDSRVLTGTEGARYPFFSPDGQSIGFFAGGKLLRVSLSGGAPVPVCDVPVVGHGASWGSDGTIVYDPGPSGLMRVSAEGGRPELLTSSDPAIDRRDFDWPQFLPDGGALLATVRPDPVAGGNSTIAAFSFRTRQWRVLTDGSQPQYVPPRYVAYHAEHVREGELQAVAFDPKELKIRGTPVPFLNGVFRARAGGAAYFAISRSGTLVFTPGGLARALVRVDRNGRRTSISDDRRGFRFPRLSPDGRYIAVAIDPRPSEIWVFDIERGTRIRLTSGLNSIAPVWTPDGRQVTYTSGADLYVQPADASSPAQLVLQREGPQYAHSWSRDGQFLLFHEAKPASKLDIWVLPTGGAPRPLLTTSANELHPAISPDGRWLAYDSDESGRAEIYVRPFPDVDAHKWPVSVDGGHSPLWSHDGRELYYLNGQRLLAVPVRPDEPTFVPGMARVLFSGPFDSTQDDNYDVFPDGTHFLMIEAAPDAMLHGLQVVLNWSAELERLVSANKTAR